MVLPLILSALGSALGGAGALGGIGALGGAAIGSGLGTLAETGDLEKGILSGLGAFAGGTAFNALSGGAAGAAGAATGGTGGTVTPLLPQLQAKQAAMGLGGIGKAALNYPTTGAGMATGIGGMVGSSLSGPKGVESTSYGNRGNGDTEAKPIPRPVQTPGAGYRPGYDPEFDYGMGKVPNAKQILDYRDKGINPYRMSGGGLLSSLQGTFGPIRMADGGIADLAQNMDGGDMAAPQGGGNEKSVVAEAIRAVKGESPNPEIALGKFLAQYGEEALRELVDKVQSGEVDDTMQRSEGKLRGAGDGMEDMIPANIDGQQDVLLSDNEYIVPADVVSGIGNGSSDAGARELDRMLERVRTARHGTPDQPPQIDKKAVMPA